MSEQKVTLLTISPDLNIKFEEALAKVMDNIGDEKYPAGRVREIQMKLRFKPDSGRDVIDVIPKVEVKLPTEDQLQASKVYANIAGDGTRKEGAVLHHPNQIEAEM